MVDRSAALGLGDEKDILLEMRNGGPINQGDAATAVETKEFFDQVAAIKKELKQTEHKVKGGDGSLDTLYAKEDTAVRPKDIQAYGEQLNDLQSEVQADIQGLNGSLKKFSAKWMPDEDAKRAAGGWTNEMQLRKNMSTTLQKALLQMLEDFKNVQMMQKGKKRRAIKNQLHQVRARRHCRFRNRGTDSLRESGIKWVSGSTKRRCDLPQGRRGGAHPPARPLRAAPLRSLAAPAVGEAVIKCPSPLKVSKYTYIRS